MNRRLDIDRAKGLAILLVVFGHLVARTDPVGVWWYEPLRRAVYSFHMPFFLYLSGLVAAQSGALFTRRAAWPALARRRAVRLLVPFFAIGLLVVLGKTLAAHFIFVDNAPTSLGAGVAALLWHTAASPALSIWYLFVLFVLSLACPLLLRCQPARLWTLLALTLLLYLLPLPAYAYLDRIGRYAVFFVVGGLAASHDKAWLAFIDQHWPVLLAALLAGCAAIALFGANWPPALTLLPMGALSMPALHGLTRRITRPGGILLTLGQYSFVIYLLNTLFIGLTKGFLLRFTTWNGEHFLPVAAILMTAGIFGPITLKRFAIRRASRLDLLTQ